MDQVSNIGQETPFGHGPGADITSLSKVELVDVHRDLAEVPGGIGHLPENTMAAFYPKRDFAYGGKVYVTVLYDSAELWRSTFNVRPLPTFIQGFVADHFLEPLGGIEVKIPDLGRKVVTDGDGCYGFGFGDKAEEVMPPGRYRAVVNPGLKNSAFGSAEMWISVEAGRLNSFGIKPIPILDSETPFRRVASGEPLVVLADGDLALDLFGAELVFPDGKKEGPIHAQSMETQHLSYNSVSYPPNWTFGLQPMGVEVSGTVGMTVTLPEVNGGHEYVGFIGPHVLLLGLDPDSLMIVPVGVGRVDTETKQVVGDGEIALKRLDIIGVAVVPEDAREILARHAAGEIGLREMVGELGADR